MLIVAILILIAYLVTISFLATAAKEKGYHLNGTGSLWFIGIFLSPITLGVYVASLPDKHARATPSEPIKEPVDQLPSL